MNVLLDAINKIDMELHKRVQRTSKYLWSLFYCCATRKKKQSFSGKADAPPPPKRTTVIDDVCAPVFAFSLAYLHFTRRDFIAGKYEAEAKEKN